jgi:hypothetical protein
MTQTHAPVLLWPGLLFLTLAGDSALDVCRDLAFFGWGKLNPSQFPVLAGLFHTMPYDTMIALSTALILAVTLLVIVWEMEQ